MLAFVYQDKVTLEKSTAALQVSTLVGIVLGQIVFGILADVYGRRKIYGWSLMVVIVGTLGLTTASTGEFDSMSILGWLIFWRLVMGLGIGVDCSS